MMNGLLVFRLGVQLNEYDLGQANFEKHELKYAAIICFSSRYLEGLGGHILYLEN